MTNLLQFIPKRSNDNLRLRPGDSVICPHCKLVMLECTKQPISGDSRWIDWFRPVNFSNKEGSMAWCPFDGWLFYDPTRGVYTREHGWTF